MTQSAPKKTTRTRKPRQSHKPKKAVKRPVKRPVKAPMKPIWRVLRRGVLWGLVFSVLVFGSYLGYLDYNVRYQFEGKRWAIPAHVYSQPFELYVGLPQSADDLERRLRKLNYRRSKTLPGPGHYQRHGQRIDLITRRFDYPEGAMASQSVRLHFNGAHLVKLEALADGEPPLLLRLEPMHIGSFYPNRKEDRLLIQLKDTPDALVQGLLATEDRDFYRHIGISPKAIARALFANIKAGDIVQGGSTITQQLVKNFYLSSERTLVRKLNEVFMAVILDYRYDKDEILEAYLNEVYLGQNGASAVHGFGLASQFYFGQTLTDLALHEIATLVALVRGPSYYDPRRHPERAKARRDLVLSEMHEAGFITLKQMHQAQAQALHVLTGQRYASNRYPAFLDLVRRQLSDTYADGQLTTEGLRIFTTLESDVQETLEHTVRTQIKRLMKRSKTDDLQTAVVVTRRDSGEVVALVGSSNPKDAGFNRALEASRPIGSLVKPAVYLTALSEPGRYTAITRLDDLAITVKSGGKNWSPANYDHKEHGQVPLHTALARSYNLATVRLGMDIGLARVAKTLRDMGVTSKIEPYPSLLLGALPLTPLEVAQLYQTLASDGFLTPLTAIKGVTDSQGQALERRPYTIRQTLPADAVYITNFLLQEVMREGTARSAYQTLDKSLQVAGKTGTTDGYRDSWFAGFGGNYLAVAWLGRDDNQPTGLSGATGALPVWTQLMAGIDAQSVALAAPDNVDLVWVDPLTDQLADSACANVRQYPFVRGSAPHETSPCVTSRQPNPEGTHWWDDLLN
ncbi:MAG: penicillin-binding protein 1B [Methylococcales bacterium]|nr:penicillin-binding protein 1B [Methylococcales bacterium]